MSEAWSLPMHATGVLTAWGLAMVLRVGWPLGIGAGLSFLGLMVAAWTRSAPTRLWGAANQVTALRLALLLALLLGAGQITHGLLVGGFALALTLDAVDGWIARRTNSTSAFGAAFDMEVDALSILVMGYLLWLLFGVGVWVLLPGILRYVYVVAIVMIPPTGEEDRRSRLGRLAFLASALSLLIAMAVDGWARTALAASASTVTCLSFARSFARTYPSLYKRLGGMARATASTLLFLLAWSLLNLAANLRYPSPEPAGWYFLPSLDIAILLVGFVALGLVGRNLPWWGRLPILLALLFVRVLRLGDGIAGIYFGKAFSLYTDLPLTAELVRYAHSTFSAPKFYAGALGLLLLVTALVFILDRALRMTAGYLRNWRQSLVFAGLVLPWAVASLFIEHDSRYNQRYTGAFAASAMPRLQRELTFLLNVYDHRATEMRAITEVQEQLKKQPARLDGLHHANVYLFFVESYGATVFDRPDFREKALPVLKDVQSRLAERGLGSVSAQLISSTYGGMSWLAHATFLTGVKTTNQLQYDLLGVSHPRTMARIMHDAGYKTVLVAPNTNRQSRVSDFYDFDTQYNAWNFDYAGPPFAWATMPDQYVLDYIRRHVVERQPDPLFLTYVLVSSHAPWSQIPTLVPNWSAIRNGAIYHSHPLHHANTNWPDFSNAAEPYVTSVIYDLEVLRDYLADSIKDDALVVILGDHQPVSEITSNSDSWSVPIHIVSRNAALLAPFLARGYVPGMIPGPTTLVMESFLADFLRDFSTGAS
jgi:phosphatidylglycerophosphate synthase